MHFTTLCSDFAFLKNGCLNNFFADGLFVGSFIRQVAIILLKDSVNFLSFVLLSDGGACVNVMRKTFAGG
uniref:Uncharacterized protein n=1 Tax=Arundo donax TaxID=35708 RepID=A0A0A9DNC4_ARUDO